MKNKDILIGSNMHTNLIKNVMVICNYIKQSLGLMFLFIPLVAVCQNNGYKIINKGYGKIAIVHNGKSTNFIQEEVNRSKEIADSIRIVDYSAQIEDMEKEIEEVKLKYFMIGLYKGVEFQYNWFLQGKVGKVIDIYKGDVNSEARKIVIEEGDKYFNKVFRNK